MPRSISRHYLLPYSALQKACSHLLYVDNPVSLPIYYFTASRHRNNQMPPVSEWWILQLGSVLFEYVDHKRVAWITLHIPMLCRKPIVCTHVGNWDARHVWRASWMPNIWPNINWDSSEYWTYSGAPCGHKALCDSAQRYEYDDVKDNRCFQNRFTTVVTVYLTLSKTLDPHASFCVLAYSGVQVELALAFGSALFCITKLVAGFATRVLWFAIVIEEFAAHCK